MAYIGNSPVQDETVSSAQIIDGAIVNADINSSAAIALSKTALVAGTGLTLSTNTLNVDAAQTGITSVGTIATGVWNGTAVASAYLDADTAHLSTVQTFSGAKTFSANVLVSGSGTKLYFSQFATGGTTYGYVGSESSIVSGGTASDMTIGASGDTNLTLTTNGAIRATLNSSGTTFAGAVNVALSDASVSPSSDADDLVVENNGACGITIGSAADSVGSLRFADSGASHAGMLYYSHASNFMKFYTDATERMIIDNAGKVGIGSQNTTLIGYADAAANNLVVGSSTGDEGITIISGASAGDYGALYFGDANRGTNGRIMYEQNNEIMSFYTNNTEKMRIALDGDVTVNTGDLIIGTAGKGISFAATADGTTMSSEVLSDYEEGIHTTAITGADTAGDFVLDSANQSLAYTKIGRMVTVQGKFQTSSGSGAGHLKISMPFTSNNGLDDSADISVGSITMNRTGSTSPSTQMTPIIFSNTNFVNIQLHNEGNANETYLQADDVDTSFEGQICISYIV